MVELYSLSPSTFRPVDVSPQLAVLLQLLADPTTRQIFLWLIGKEATSGELADHLGVPPPLMSRHLRLLKAARLIRWRRDADDARRIYYRAHPIKLQLIADELHFWFSPIATGSGSRRS